MTNDDARARQVELAHVERTVAAIRAAGGDEEARTLEARALERTDNGPRPGDGPQPEQPESAK